MKITFLEGESPILWLLWKMLENMFFLVSEHVGMAGNAPSKKIISEGGGSGGVGGQGGETSSSGGNSHPNSPEEFSCYSKIITFQIS